MCFGTTGPGATNLLPGVAAAWADNIPMLVVTPSNQSDVIDPYRDLLQQVDHLALYRSVTKWSARVTQAERAPELFERALYMARSGRPGPVHLDIPSDIATFACDYDLAAIPVISSPRPAPSPAEVEAITALLRSARRPVLLAGGGVARSDATEAFRTFARTTGIPYATTAKALGVADFADVNHIGSCGFWGGPAVVRACEEADLIVAIGCKFSTWVPIHKPPVHVVPQGQTIVQIDIDPAMLGKNAPITHGYVGDARTTLTLLEQALGDASLTLADDWSAGLSRDRSTYMQDVTTFSQSAPAGDNGAVNTAAFVYAATRQLPRDTIIVMDGGQISSWDMTFVQPRSPRHLAHSAGMGHMGFGLPAAIGAKLANPDRPVVVLTGDGAAGLTIQELETAARHGLNIVMVVLNDSAWGCYLPLETVLDNKHLGLRLSDVDFARIAEGFGCRGENVATPDELTEALERALAAGKPTLINARTIYTPHPMDRYWGSSQRGVNLRPAQPAVLEKLGQRGDG